MLVRSALLEHVFEFAYHTHGAVTHKVAEKGPRWVIHSMWTLLCLIYQQLGDTPRNGHASTVPLQCPYSALTVPLQCPYGFYSSALIFSIEENGM